MRARQLVISVDYEIFGDGSGDVRRHILEPTERMVRACEKFGMPLTVFFEVEEYLAYVRERVALVADLGYDPGAEMRAQAIDLVKRGHDLQLHLHPEWVDCRFVGGVWQLRPEKTSVDSLFESQEDVTRYIGERKAVIDGIYAEAGSSRRVRAYRAGAFCAQPGKRLLKALSTHGIVIDSSVVKGMVRQDELAQLDMRSAPPGKRHWHVSEDVACEDAKGSVTEIPIYSRMGRRYQQLTPRRLMAKFSGNVPKRKQRELVSQLGMGRTPMSVLKFLAREFPIKLDFHNMSSRQLLRWIREAPAAPAGDQDVIVLIGHSKEHRDDVDFERFLEGISKDSSLKVVSFDEVAASLVMPETRRPALAM